MNTIVVGRESRPLGAWAAQRAMRSLVCGLSLSMPLLCAAQWMPNETLVSPQPDLFDMEFSQARAQFCWSDEGGALWIGNGYPVTGNGVDQVFYRDFDTNVSQQLTFDSGNKYEVWMWRAPEFGNELIFMTLVDDVELRVYRLLSINGAPPQWTPIYDQFAPSG